MDPSIRAVANKTTTQSAVDWDMFCRALCEVTLFEDCARLGGPGKVVQINVSKIGKSK